MPQSHCEVYVRTSSGLVIKGKIIKEHHKSQLYCKLKLPDGKSVVRCVQKKHCWTVELQSNCSACGQRAGIGGQGDYLICSSCGRLIHEKCSKSEPNTSRKRIFRLPGQETKSPSAAGWCADCLLAKCAAPFGARVPEGMMRPMCFLRRYWPYEVERLNWDVLHRVNSQSVYCYCGGPGVFWQRMFQCAKCLQWFHEACLEIYSRVSCGRTLIPWDCNWFFMCARCNLDRELLIRIPPTRCEVVHIALMNLYEKLGNKFIHLEYDIVPWIRRHAAHLFVSHTFAGDNLTRSVQETLLQNPDRFQSAAENAGNIVACRRPAWDEAADQLLLYWRVRCPRGGPLRPVVTTAGIFPIISLGHALSSCCRTAFSAHTIVDTCFDVDFPSPAAYRRASYTASYEQARGSFERACWRRFGNTIGLPCTTPVDQQKAVEINDVKTGIVSKPNPVVPPMVIRLKAGANGTREIVKSTKPSREKRLKSFSKRRRHNGNQRTILPSLGKAKAIHHPLLGCAQGGSDKIDERLVVMKEISDTSGVPAAPAESQATTMEITTLSSPQHNTRVESCSPLPHDSEASSSHSNVALPTTKTKQPPETSTSSRLMDLLSADTALLGPPEKKSGRNILDWLPDCPSDNSLFLYPWERTNKVEHEKRVSDWLQGKNLPVRTTTKRFPKLKLGYKTSTDIFVAETGAARITARRHCNDKESLSDSNAKRARTDEMSDYLVLWNNRRVV